MEALEPTRRPPPLPHPLEEGWTLPASWYSGDAVLELERERIFASAWQYAGPAELVAEPESFMASVAGHIPVVVTRARGRRVARSRQRLPPPRRTSSRQGCGSRATLQCPYHAWTYELDGSLRARAALRSRSRASTLQALSLLPVSVDTWGPFVFVNPDAEARCRWRRPSAACRRTVAQQRARSRRPPLSLARSRGSSAVNWKVALENYLECYHCPVAHPGFSKHDRRRSRLVPAFHGGRRSLSQVGPLREGGPPGDMSQSQYHFLWPNTTINICCPGPQNVSIERWVPVRRRARPSRRPTTSSARESPAERIEETIEFDTQVATEDVSLVESVQRGLDSQTVVQGRLMPQSEQLVAAFQRRVHDALLG